MRPLCGPCPHSRGWCEGPQGTREGVEGRGSCHIGVESCGEKDEGLRGGGLACPEWERAVVRPC